MLGKVLGSLRNGEPTSRINAPSLIMYIELSQPSTSMRNLLHRSGLMFWRGHKADLSLSSRRLIVASLNSASAGDLVQSPAVLGIAPPLDRVNMLSGGVYSAVLRCPSLFGGTDSLLDVRWRYSTTTAATFLGHLKVPWSDMTSNLLFPNPEMFFFCPSQYDLNSETIVPDRRIRLQFALTPLFLPVPSLASKQGDVNPHYTGLFN